MLSPYPGMTTTEMSATPQVLPGGRGIATYSLCDVVDYHGAVRIPVVHRRQRLVPFLPGRIPNLEFDCRVLVEGDGLCEEGGADGRFSVRVELVLAVCQREGDKGPAARSAIRTFTNRKTIEL